MQDNFIEKEWSLIYLDIPKDINRNNTKYFKNTIMNLQNF